MLDQTANKIIELLICSYLFDFTAVGKNNLNWMDPVDVLSMRTWL
jgi:hypothetical protein